MRISDWSSDVCSSDLKALFDLKPDTGEGNRRQRVLQGKEISGSLLAHQIGTGGERLTQLDRGGANRLKGFGIARLLGHACSETGETRQTADRQWRQRVLLYAGERLSELPQQITATVTAVEDKIGRAHV